MAVIQEVENVLVRSYPIPAKTIFIQPKSQQVKQPEIKSAVGLINGILLAVPMWCGIIYWIASVI